ncbi:recombinase family protein [Paracoccus sphaerophysae]|uniref:recombinase family protein n=1 Tax=Paracoccus sphaerophysae TaxID=690417 RepID=UPI001E2A640F|nr:recombinase family protein [Paracoccus sphaerophysae]
MVVVTKYDRLSRSLLDLLGIVAPIQAHGAGFRSIAEDTTTTPAGRLVFHVFAAIAQFECERIAARTREGLAAARRRGRLGGRPPCPLARAARRGPPTIWPEVFRSWPARQTYMSRTRSKLNSARVSRPLVCASRSSTGTCGSMPRFMSQPTRRPDPQAASAASRSGWSPKR